MIFVTAKSSERRFNLAKMLSFGEEIRDLNWLREMVQFGIELEFATIPPYLTALWSIKDTTTSPAPNIILPIVLQEMLHMGTMCNLLNSLGQIPLIADSKVVPIYPGCLPGGVHPTLQIILQPLSKELVAKTFMIIEEPETGPVKYALGQTFPTIGAFYTAISDCVAKLPDSAFSNLRQLTIDRPDFPLGAITNRTEALAALEMIKDQGEGASGSPLYGPTPDDISHYYLFGELYHEKELVQMPGGNHWEYSGMDLPFPAASDIYPMAPIPNAGYVQSAAFDNQYSQMLRQMQSAWATGGDDGAALLTQAQQTMGALGQLAIELMKTPIAGTALTYGPCFRYIPPQPTLS